VSERVRYRVADGIARVVLDAPERLNAVDPEMLDAVVGYVSAAAEEPGVRVVAVTGSGRGFCSGANLAVGSVGSVGSGGSGGSGAVEDGTLLGVSRVARALVACPRPTVALVNGVAAGAGASMALACDYVLATASASFVLAFARIGLMPDGGATALVAANVGRARAMRMALTGEAVPAAVAAEWGLVSECVPDEDFAKRSEELLTRLAAFSPGAAAETKAAINAATLDLEAALEREEGGQTRLLASEDLREGIAAFLEKRPPAFRGS
jgi:enoyl-CoA hydratase